MPSYFPLQGLDQTSAGQVYANQRPPANGMAPAKRPVNEDDDDIQFISEKPVKRHKAKEKQPSIPVPQQPMISFPGAANTAASATVPNTSITATETATGISGSGPMDMERRLSTGMVGLPPDMNAIELTYALRGVSMPVLENFVLDQPIRRPRPPRSPQLSPKQLPSTISSTTLSVPSNQHVPMVRSFPTPSNAPAVCPSPSHTSCIPEKPGVTTNSTRAVLGTDKPHASETHMNSGHASPTLSTPGNPTGPSSATTHLTVPAHSEATHITPCSGSNPRLSEHHPQVGTAQPPKQPCQACSRLRHHAQLSRTQGLPMVQAFPPHFMPQLHCHPAYGQNFHPQGMGMGMAMPMGDFRQLGPNLGSVMVPVNSTPFAPLPSNARLQPQSQPPPPPPPPPQQVAPKQQKGDEKVKEQHVPENSKKAASPKASKAKNGTAKSSVAPSPIRPPASLIQPTYRKPSPNLIVDVAETCQETFPFEEVAKRHNVPVNKVFEIFAAIIQVPLLRCPTDRRRQGRLATARIKEYNKAKKDVRESTARKGGEGAKRATAAEDAIAPADIAQRLGQAEFPEGFTLGGNS